MRRLLEFSTVAAFSLMSERLFANIHPFRPDWNRLEADSGNRDTGLIIAAGICLSAAVLLAVYMLRRMRPQESNTDSAALGKENPAIQGREPQSKG